MTGHDNISSDVAEPGPARIHRSTPRRPEERLLVVGIDRPLAPLAGRRRAGLHVRAGRAAGTLKLAQSYAGDYLGAATTQVRTDPETGEATMAVVDGTDLIAKYPSLDNALAAQLAFEGSYEQRSTWPLLTDYPGRETAIKAPPGQVLQLQGCVTRDLVPRFVNDREYSWFDFDCDYCTGAYSSVIDQGLFHRTWLAESPPPSPNTNLGVSYNYTDNPIAGSRRPGTGRSRSRGTTCPRTRRIRRRAGSTSVATRSGRSPTGRARSGRRDPPRTIGRCSPSTGCSTSPTTTADGERLPTCPNVYIPQKRDSMRICLTRGDIWDHQSGDIIHPDPTLRCVGLPDVRGGLGAAARLGGDEDRADALPGRPLPVRRPRGEERVHSTSTR